MSTASRRKKCRANRGSAFPKPARIRRSATARPKNLDLFRRMKAGEFKEGEHVLRAKIDMASPNFNMRDPAIYRIRYAHHYRTGDKWCIYPMYDYTHCDVGRAGKHHAFAVHAGVRGPPPALRLVPRELAEGGIFTRPLPQQIEFSRLNLTYAITSKRKLLQLVKKSHRRRLGRSAHADHRRCAPARLHAGERYSCSANASA
jgi:glutaminyl-tRNA synthetase